MRNLFSKIIVSALILCCPLCLGLVKPVKAHAGHEHLPDELREQLSTSALRRALREEFKPYLDKKFEIVIDGAHEGHFYLNKIKTKNNNTLFKLEQTFHLDSSDLVDSKVKAEYSSDDKTLKYHVNGEENDYEIWVDFQNLDGEDNSGVRITYSNDLENRKILVEDIIVRQVIESEDSSHGDGSLSHGEGSDMEM